MLSLDCALSDLDHEYSNVNSMSAYMYWKEEPTEA